MTDQDYLARAVKIGNRKEKPYNFGATMYGSHEPCLMCFSCAAWANVARVVYAEPANEDNFMYEFRDYSLQDMAKHLTRRKISVEHILLEKK